jgi:hypothetical protein
MVATPTLQLLEWIDERQRSYAETMEAWRSSCPRLTIWEDAVAEGLVGVRDGRVVVTARGRELVERRIDWHASDELVLSALPAQD